MSFISPNLNPNYTATIWRVTLSQTLAVLAKNVVIIVWATTVAFPTMLIPALSANGSDDMFQLNETEISWIGSISLLCIPVGCAFSGFITQPIGRRRAMQWINVPFAMCWLTLYFSNQLWHIYFALSVMGLVGGLVEAPLFAYVSEVTEPRLRGILSATTSIASGIGILSQFLAGSLLHWRTVALISCSIPIVCFFLLSFIPESPYWLISKSRLDDAQKNLAWLRGWTTTKEVEEEFQEILQSCKDQKKEHHSENANGFLIKLKMLVHKSFLWPFTIVIFIFFLSQFTGGTTVRVYAVKLFSVLEAPIDKYYATVFLGLAELLGAITTVAVIRKTGKRLIAFISLFLICVSNVVVATYAYYVNIKYFNVINETSEPILDIEIYKWIPFTFLFLLAYATHTGLRIIPWILVGEVYLHDIRPIGCGLSGAICLLLGFTANKIYLDMISSCTIAGTYWIHASISFFGIVVVYFTLPETEGKTLTEITNHFSGVAKLEKETGVKRKFKPNHHVNLGFKNDIDIAMNYKPSSESKF